MGYVLNAADRKARQPDVYYRFTEDVTLRFHRGRVLSTRNIETDLFNDLVAEGVLEVAEPIAYAHERRYTARLVEENGKPLDRLATVAEFQSAFDRRGIWYGKYWRLIDYIAEARRYMAQVDSRRRLAPNERGNHRRAHEKERAARKGKNREALSDENGT